MKYKSKRSKLTDIPESVKKKVFERDGGKCIYCGSRNGIPNAHYKPRSQGGLGIEQNIVTLCPKCHHDYDNGILREKIGNYIKEYLKSIYGAMWNESDLLYNKWQGFKFNK